jgi:glyoxalase family protein
MIANNISGLHHVTALCSDAQENMDFYSGILGLRMVKKTINFDAPDVYHLYYGNYEGAPGTLMTFFPYPGIGQGRKGVGQVTVTAFSVPRNSLGYWVNRLNKFDVACSGPKNRFGSEEVIYFEDYDGLGIEIVANDMDNRESFNTGHIPREFAIKGFFGVTLTLQGREETEDLLTGFMNHKVISSENERYRYSPSGRAGEITDIVIAPDGQAGKGGSGTVHHVAFATDNEDSQLGLRKILVTGGYQVTPVIDRQYFKSVYFREPGGVLFEIATNPPGMTVDEEIEKLGHDLQLAPWHEEQRSYIESRLEEISLNIEKFSD